MGSERSPSLCRPTLPVPRDLCDQCRMCCRFTDPDRSPWVSRTGDLTDFPESFSAARPLRLLPLPEAPADPPVWRCSALGSDGLGCDIWGEHPADCRLYPLLVVFREGSFRMVLDPDCPFSSRESPSFFRRHADRFLSEEWVRMTPEGLRAIRPFAEREDRPHFQEVLVLPHPVAPRRGSALP